MLPPEAVLASEDSLRLNVLLTQAQAVRIDERGPTVVGLAGSRELRVQLHPQGREDAYLLAVRRLLANLVIGHPGGFPVFIRRWLRGGQLENLRTADLLKLGEPEAVLAAAAAPGIDDEVARRAWWACPSAAVARALLGNPVLPRDGLKPELAAWLAEHLPFEQDDEAIMQTLRLVAAPGLLPPALRERLWRRGSELPAYRVGFLLAAPGDLPEQRPPRAGQEEAAALAEEAGSAPLAALLAHALDGPGQAFLAACDGVLGNPSDREIISPLLNLLGAYAAAAGFPGEPPDTVEQLAEGADAALADAATDAAGVVARLPQLAAEVRALVLLAGANEALCYAVFARSTATGTLLRDKLATVLQPLRDAIAALLGASAKPTLSRRQRQRLSRSG
ncbi:MAG TPA: sulfur reduction protein DsrS [Gammaproteobacteria bacterium]